MACGRSRSGRVALATHLFIAAMGMEARAQTLAPSGPPAAAPAGTSPSVPPPPPPPAPPPAAAPATPPAAAPATPPAAAPASPAAAGPAQSAVSSAAAAPPSVEEGASSPVDELLQWYVPPQAEMYQAPPPPEAPKPPRVKNTFSAYFQTNSFISGIDGTGAEIGAKIGLGSSLALVLGYWVPNGHFVPGVEFLRQLGGELMQAGPVRLMWLGPTLRMKFYTDFSDDLLMAMGGSITGIRAAGCGPLPWFVELRGPHFDFWLPASADGASFDSGYVTPLASWGIAIEAGIVRF